MAARAHWWPMRPVGAAVNTPATKDLVPVMQNLAGFLPMIAILAAFMYFASRKQKRAMQATIDLHESLQIGDRVRTHSGLEGTIAARGDNTVQLEIAPGVVTTWTLMSIQGRVEPETEESVARELTGEDVDDNYS